MKQYSNRERTEMKAELYFDSARGTIDIREAARRMRKIIGLTQAEYANQLLH